MTDHSPITPEKQPGSLRDSSPEVEAYENRLKIVHTDGTVDYIDDKAVGGDASEMPKGYFYSVKFICVLVAHCLANICAYAGWVMPANTLTLINEDLGPSPNISWVSTAWSLSNCIGFLLFGRLSDIFGRRYAILGVHVLGLIGCIIGATAPTVETLIAANVFNGLAAAGQLSFGITMGELVSNKMRGPVIALIFFAAAPFAIFGPTIARSLIANTGPGWRWCFYMGIIFTVCALTLYAFTYFPPSYDQLHAGKSKKQQFKELDFIGIFLFTAGCVLFLIGLSWGGTIYPWASAPTLCTLIIGFFTLGFFAAYEAFWCKTQPLMPARLFKNIPFTAITVVAFIAAMIYYSLTVIWPTMVMTVYGSDDYETGMRSSIIGGGILLGQVMAGIMISYVPGVKWQAVICSVISLAFFGALASLSPDSWNTTIALAAVGLTAIGYIDNISFPGITLVIEPGDIGLATGVMGSIRAFGGAIAQALYTSVLNNKLAESLPAYVTPAATEAGLPVSSLTALFAAITAGDLTTVPGMTPKIAAAVGQATTMAYTVSFRLVFYVTIPFSVIMIISAFWVPNLGQYLGNNVARRIQNTGSRKAGEAPSSGSDAA